MPFVPHTEDDIKSMLDAIGAKSIEELFDEIPEKLRCGPLNRIPDGLTEMEINRHIAERGKANNNGLNFIGAGAYEHHVPAAVWDIASRGEFLTAYTPYQAEASQGTLQLLYEYQTMMASLTGMDVANASLYDGGSALAEAVLMAVRANRKSKSKKILVAGTIHPHYVAAVKAIVTNQQIELIELAYSNEQGCTITDGLQQYNEQDIAAVVVQHPNFFGVLEDVDVMTDWAHAHNALMIASVNPISLSLFKEPGDWGDKGADIVCGEGQPLGVPLAYGGPYFGFMCCRQEFVRQMPGRIIGRTEDSEGKQGFSLTLQAREQHIRRSKATSNICTNQGLLVTAATVYMSLLGMQGLQRIAKACHAKTRQLVAKLTEIDGVETVFNHTYFHEAVIKLPQAVKPVLKALLAHDIHGGLDISPYFSELDNCLLVCVTETKTEKDIDAYVTALRAVLSGDVKKKSELNPAEELATC